MKTIRISDETHRKLTATLGTLMAQTGKMQTYQDVIEALLTQSVILPHELLKEVEDFIRKNGHEGYTRKEEFICQAIRFHIKWDSDKYVFLKISKEKYERLKVIVKEISTPYRSVSDFIQTQIEEVLERYDKHLEGKSQLDT